MTKRGRDARFVAKGTPRIAEWYGEAAGLLLLAWPIILTNFVELAFTTVNFIALGALGQQTLAAVTIASNLFFFVGNFGVGVVSGVSALIAKKIGSGTDPSDDVRGILQQGIWASAILSIPGLVCLLNAEAILVLLGQQPQVAALAAVYLECLGWALPPFIGYVALRSAAAAMGRPHAALWAAIVGIAINAILAWSLTYGYFGLPALGIRGAGIATAIATWSIFLILAVALAIDQNLSHYGLFRHFGRTDLRRLYKIFRLGIPIGVSLAFETAIFTASALLMGSIGEVDLAAHGIAIQLASLAFMVPLGLSQAVTVRVGLAYGAHEGEAVWRAGWTAYACGIAFMSASATVMLIAPGLLIGRFIDLADPANNALVDRATLFVTFAALFQIADGAQVVAAGMLRGLHDTVMPMLIAVFGYWVIGLPLGALLAFNMGFGGTGLWLGLICGLSIAAVLLTARWLVSARLHQRQMSSP